MGSENYVKSHAYESFIRLARLCDRDDFGARNSHMQNLMDKEEGLNQVSLLKHETLLSDVKKNMASAARHAIKRNLEKAVKDKLKSYLPRIEAASVSEELLSICEEGRELLLKYKPN